MTIAEIASSDEMKLQIKQALEHTAIEVALRALEDENMPELQIKAPAAGMDLMHVIALDAAKRAGAQSVIRRLRKLPFLTVRKIKRAIDMGGSWEYLGEEQEALPSSVKPKTKKP